MRRRHLLPVLLTISLGLAACVDTDPAAGPSTPASEPATDPASPDEATPDPVESPSTPDTSTPTPTATPTAGPTASEPTSDQPVAGDCSAAGMTAADVDLSPLPDQARATAESLLDAALRCDEQLLATAAEESDTQLTFGDADPYEFFGLPEGDDKVYATIVTLLTETAWAAEADDSVPATFVWPRVHTGDWADSDEAWAEVVAAGLLTKAQADDMRTGGSGYLGWRLGISGDGTWLFLVAGD